MRLQTLENGKEMVQNDKFSVHVSHIGSQISQPCLPLGKELGIGMVNIEILRSASACDKVGLSVEFRRHVKFCLTVIGDG